MINLLSYGRTINKSSQLANNFTSLSDILLQQIFLLVAYFQFFRNLKMSILSQCVPINASHLSAPSILLHASHRHQVGDVLSYREKQS